MKANDSGTTIVNLEILVPGDRIEYRCGGRDTVVTAKAYSGLAPDNAPVYGIRVESSTCEIAACYRRDGLVNTGKKNPHDIVAIHPAKKHAPAALDLTKAKVGDKVTVEIALDEGDIEGIKQWGHLSRSILSSQVKRVIALEPAPEPEFDWAMVKPGMAFKGPNDSVFKGIRHFVGILPTTPTRYAFDMGGSIMTATNLGQFTRVPEHDIALPEAA